MEQRVSPDQGQQRTEIPTLPNRKRKNTISQLLRKRYYDITLTGRQPVL